MPMDSSYSYRFVVLSLLGVAGRWVAGASRVADDFFKKLVLKSDPPPLLQQEEYRKKAMSRFIELHPDVCP
jgi:hypothetical protein